jgi:hypothetical protein
MKYGLGLGYLGVPRRARTVGARLGAIFAVVAVLLGLTGPSGCSSSSSQAGPPCGHSSHCGSGTACIDDGSGSGPSCKKVCTGQADCPFNTYCNDGLANGLAADFCAPTTYPVTEEPTGQWGALCLPPGGGSGDSLCDTADYFECYGTSPADANPFCTIADCVADSDCRAGWWCALVDIAPNFTTTTRSFGRANTRRVCLPRQYCDPCQMDHDCPLAKDRTQQHCVPDSNGKGFCAPQCATSDNCHTGDATCSPQWGVCAQAACASDADCPASADGGPNGGTETCVAQACRLTCKRDADCPPANGVAQHCANGACSPPACASDDDCPPTAVAYQHCNAGVCAPECGLDTDCNPVAGDQRCVTLSVCTPRAGACVGDGSFCQPCRSDADCSSGYCLVSKYSKERFCSQTVAGMQGCSATSGPPPGGCPARPSGSNYKAIACTIVSDDFSLPNQCIGEVTFGVDAQGQPQLVPGCWTTNR